jgi:hypothetical protein
MDLYGSLICRAYPNFGLSRYFYSTITNYRIVACRFSAVSNGFCIVHTTRLDTLLRQHVLDCAIVAPSFKTRDGMILTIVRALLVLTLL